jgi:carboxypeptidase C (cathepsin A)
MFLQKGHLDVYALDYPVCKDSSARYGRMERTWMMNHMLHEMQQIYPEMHNEEVRKLKFLTKGLQSPLEYDPCSEDYMSNYLNQLSVKEAIHVKTDRDWVQCGDYRTMTYNISDQFSDMTPFYNYLIDSKLGLKILVYSGDDDFMCPTWGTQSWIWNLGYEVEGKEWAEWFINDQTAGYITKWKNTHMTFATVHSAGHMVPACKPEAAYWLYENYLFGDLIPTSSE